MKTKSILFILAAVVLLSSFTFVTNTKEVAAARQNTEVKPTTASGSLAMEDAW